MKGIGRVTSSIQEQKLGLSCKKILKNPRLFSFCLILNANNVRDQTKQGALSQRIKADDLKVSGYSSTYNTSYRNRQHTNNFAGKHQGWRCPDFWCFHSHFGVFWLSNRKVNASGESLVDLQSTKGGIYRKISKSTTEDHPSLKTELNHIK